MTVQLKPIRILLLSISMNLWNLHKTNSRFNILQKTQAHRKHLLNLLAARSQIDTKGSKDSHCLGTPRSKSIPTSIDPHKKVFWNKQTQQSILKENQQMVQRIVRNRHHPQAKSQADLTHYSRNLKTYSSLGRSIKLKQIERQNQKMFNRLVSTNSTIKRGEWQKRNVRTAKYKQNLHKNKYMNPDYSHQAVRIITKYHQPKFKMLNHCHSNKSFKISKKDKL